MTHGGQASMNMKTAGGQARDHVDPLRSRAPDQGVNVGVGKTEAGFQAFARVR